MDHADLLGLLALHPEAASKIGCGVDRFFVDAAAPNEFNGGGTCCFWLVRTDGTTTDWSYRVALGGKHRGTRERVSLACRAIVADQVVEVMRQARGSDGNVRCAESGKILPHGAAEVDHAPPWPFWRIVDVFCEREGGIDAVAARLRPTEDGISREMFVDEDMARRFAEWHRSVAVLRVVAKDTNARWGDHRAGLQ